MNKPPLNLPIGYKINRWTIIGEPVSRNGRKHYPCRCDCGREELKRADNLKSGHSIGHRGCPLANTPIDESVKIEKQWKYKAENKTEGIFLKNNLLGNFLGPYFIASIAKRDKYGDIYYNCIDNDGNIKQYRTQQLHAMYGLEENNIYFKQWTPIPITAHDGILKEYNGSSLEQITQQWLEKHNILFEKEYVFNDLYGEQCHLRFDFKIKNQSTVIECQGKQHYQYIPFLHNNNYENFQLQQRYDNLKKAYCKKNNIKLIVIPYNYNNLNEYLSQLL